MHGRVCDCDAVAELKLNSKVNAKNNTQDKTKNMKTGEEDEILEQESVHMIRPSSDLSSDAREDYDDAEVVDVSLGEKDGELSNDQKY